MTKKLDAKGFTIVELLIATLVFSTVLLVVTIGIIQITRVYYKGITESSTQNTARTLMDTITQAIQFSGGTVTDSDGDTVCLGNQQLSYRTGVQMVNGGQAVVRLNSLAGCTNASPANFSSGTEFMSPKMRLASLSVQSQGNNLYKVQVKVVYGADDLLNNPGNANASCKPGAGSQFCSVSELTSTVVKRVQ